MRLTEPLVKDSKYKDTGAWLGMINTWYWLSYMYFIVLEGESVPTNKLGLLAVELSTMGCLKLGGLYWCLFPSWYHVGAGLGVNFKSPNNQTKPLTWNHPTPRKSTITENLTWNYKLTLQLHVSPLSFSFFSCIISDLQHQDCQPYFLKYCNLGSK